MRGSRLALAAALAAVVAVAALAAAYAYSRGLGPSEAAPVQQSLGPHHHGPGHPAPHGWRHTEPRHGKGWTGHAPLAGVEVSPGFQNRVIAVLQNDSRTAKLLDEGYTVARIKPLFKLYVAEDGTTTVKAVKATVLLVKTGEDGEQGRAIAIVDLENNTVTRLVVHQAYYGNHTGHGHS